MQTFLPYKSFLKTASTLDYRRLGKQRIECKQIINTLQGNTKGWINHPAVKMWKNYELTLCEYALCICEEWINRGYNDNQKSFFLEQYKLYNNMIYPNWLGNEDLHASHRSNLLRKDFVFYSKYKWTEKDDLEYVWPV